MIDYGGLPHALRGGLQRYIEERVPTGGFLAAVLRNDLGDACRRADPFNRGHVADLVEWLDRHAPAACFGSAEKVHAWLAGDASPAPTAPPPMEFALFLQRFATFATGTSSALARSMDQLDTIIVNQGKSMALQDDILAEAKRNSALTEQLLTGFSSLHDENKALHDQIADVAPADNAPLQDALTALRANDARIDAVLNPAPADIPAAPAAADTGSGTDTVSGAGATSG